MSRNLIVRRDVNHPCVVMWDNGNHDGFNPGQEKVFYEFDIQGRRVLHLDDRNSSLRLPANPALPIGTKTQKPEILGPQGQPNRLGGEYRGTVYLRFEF